MVEERCLVSLDQGRVAHYASSLEHLLAELHRIDLLVQAAIQRARDLEPADREFRGLCISEQEIDAILARPVGLPRWASTAATPGHLAAALSQVEVCNGERKAESVRRGVQLRLDELVRLFELNPFETDCLLICLAPELDLRFERVYSYLQDDVTKKRPSVDLFLNLLCPSFEAKLAARSSFLAGAPLMDHRLLSLSVDPSHPEPPLLAKYAKIDSRVVQYLMGQDQIDERIMSIAHRSDSQAELSELCLPGPFKNRLSLLSEKAVGQERAQILYFQGPAGVGKQATAEALSRQLGVGLLVVDGARVVVRDDLPIDVAVRLIVREARLQDSLLLLRDFDAFLGTDKKRHLDALLGQLDRPAALTFLTGSGAWEPTRGDLRRTAFLRVEFPAPTYEQRVELWNRSLGELADTQDIDAEALGSRFTFTAGSIRSAAAIADNLARWRDPEDQQVNMDDLYAACRLQSNPKLSALAQKITPHYKWGDIVLPADQLQQLREICNCVKHRSLVYDRWGFDRKLAMGKGLNALFAGPSGTGKTMASDIIAGALGLDLYKIDLSTVVSKYIGETEKNLSAIFTEAATSNAILFFDEADALFGRRSQVRDSHDRYANIEIGYLLQKMEEYEGIVILATNFRKNMDDAFVRRMHFTVEFPFPDEKDRRRIWKTVWPENTPRHETLDLDFMAKRFEMAGGHIRNVALAAAFLAADDGGLINMSHMIRATRREHQKMGKVVMENEFGEYVQLAMTP